MTSDVIHPVDSIHPLHEKKEAIPNGSVPSITNSNSPEPIEIDAAVEKRIRRKLDRVVVTLVFLAYMAAFLDRSNIGNAETAGMSKDLGFDDAQYQVCPPPTGAGGNCRLTGGSGC
jgi:hypothetical protein